MEDLKLEQLEEKILEELGMELMDLEIKSVKKTIENWEKHITSDEFNDDCIGDLEIIKELKKFIEYDCMYAINAEYGGCWGQGYTIVDKDLNFINFVRTI